jgi:predicted SnoaL-like aldol condensation-catalyzing enzyme
MRTLVAAALLIAGGALSAQEPTPPMTKTPPQVALDHDALLASPDPRLAANKKLVYDMYRIVLQAGIWERAGEFIRDDYVQHNPNAGQGLAGVQDYIRKTRPERPIQDRLELPLINLVAERDMVMTAFVRPEKDAAGQTYYSTWFDLYRIEDGKIAEHWDPMLKSDAPIDPNDKKL